MYFKQIMAQRKFELYGMAQKKEKKSSRARTSWAILTFICANEYSRASAQLLPISAINRLWVNPAGSSRTLSDTELYKWQIKEASF